MAKPEKKVEVRFGAFQCSIEGYDDPVAQLRDVLGLMQKMIAETPALAETGDGFDPEPISDALDDVAPGIVVVRNDTQPPRDVEDTADASEVAEDDADSAGDAAVDAYATSNQAFAPVPDADPVTEPAAAFAPEPAPVDGRLQAFVPEPEPEDEPEGTSAPEPEPEPEHEHEHASWRSPEPSAEADPTDGSLPEPPTDRDIDAAPIAGAIAAAAAVGTQALTSGDDTPGDGDDDAPDTSPWAEETAAEKAPEDETPEPVAERPRARVNIFAPRQTEPPAPAASAEPEPQDAFVPPPPLPDNFMQEDTVVLTPIDDAPQTDHQPAGQMGSEVAPEDAASAEPPSEDREQPEDDAPASKPARGGMIGSVLNIFAPGAGRGQTPDDEPQQTTIPPAPPLDPAPAPQPMAAQDPDPLPEPMPFPEDPTKGGFQSLLQRVHGAGMMSAPGESDTPPPSSEDPSTGPAAADLAARDGDLSISGQLAASAAWLTLVKGQSSFSRREVMEVLETIPSDSPRELADRIRGFGRLVRGGRLVLIDDGVFAMAQPDRDRYQQIVSGS